MAKFIVYISAIASATVEVEAEDGEEAVEIAFGGKVELPYASAFAGFELSEWTTNSELFPQFAKPEEDYEEVFK